MITPFCAHWFSERPGDSLSLQCFETTAVSPVDSFLPGKCRYADWVEPTVAGLEALYEWAVRRSEGSHSPISLLLVLCIPTVGGAARTPGLGSQHVRYYPVQTASQQHQGWSPIWSMVKLPAGRSARCFLVIGYMVKPRRRKGAGNGFERKKGKWLASSPKPQSPNALILANLVDGKWHLNVFLFFISFECLSM